MRRFLIAILMVGLILAMSSTGTRSQVIAATESATQAATDAALFAATTSAAGQSTAVATEVATSAPVDVAATSSATASSTPAGSAESWTLSTLLRLKPGIPFAWLRNAASSSAKDVDTAIPSDYLVVAGPVQADSVQYWWLVRRVGGTGAVGYVEQKSLQLAIGPTAIPTTAVPPTAIPTTAVPTTPAPTTPAPAQTPQAWAVGSALHINAMISFAWVRPVPKSNAAILGTLLPLAKVTVASATPVYDGVQYWWAITVTATGLQGWVEQNSLVPDSSPAATTAVPTTAVPATAVATTAVPTTAVPATATKVSACGLSNTAEPWVALNVVSVKTCVPSLWVRNLPASNAAVIATVLPGKFLLIAGASKSDGTQIWWPVQIPATNTVGWVEQGAIQLVGTPATNFAGGDAATPAATSLG